MSELFGVSIIRQRKEGFSSFPPAPAHSRRSAKELNIPSSEVPIFKTYQQNTLTGIIIVLSEVLSVARELEAGLKVTLSPAPRLLRQLIESFRIFAMK